MVRPPEAHENLNLNSSFIYLYLSIIGKGRVLHMLKNGERKKRDMKKKRKRYDIETII